MPKDQFDFDDPLELNGMAFATDQDTTGVMCECFVEEFMRMGCSPARVLALFQTPHYLGMHMVWQKRGAPFVRQTIVEVFARWGRPCVWPESSSPAAGRPPPIEAAPVIE